MGGRVEEKEFGDLKNSALRELQEETGIQEKELRHFTLRRILVHARLNMPFTLLLYFTGTLLETKLPDCPEGTLKWINVAEMPNLDMIGSTRPVIPLLLEDCERNPEGSEDVRIGVAKLFLDGEVERIMWI